jgi:hypothetical protein
MELETMERRFLYRHGGRSQAPLISLFFFPWVLFSDIRICLYDILGLNIFFILYILSYLPGLEWIGS